MELLLDIVGYGLILVILGTVLFVFVKLLTTALSALINNDD
jgi:hypothetical protein